MLTETHAEYHFDDPIKHLTVAAQVAMVLGAACSIVMGVSRQAADFIMSAISLVVYLVALNPDGSVDNHRREILSEIPVTITTALEKFKLDGRTTMFAVCPACNCTYDPIVLPGSNISSYPERCTNRPRTKSCPESTCDALLLEHEESPGMASKPIKTFIYYHFHDYLASLLSRADIEAVMDSACDTFMSSVNADPSRCSDIQSGMISDVFGGTFLREFYHDYDKQSLFLDRKGGGRYVFTYFVDFFSPEGVSLHSAAKSCGVIIMACLNLPEDIRYKPENLYVAGIIPGPKEPPLEQLNHFMRPVLRDLRDSWVRGVRYTRTALSPSGRTTHSAIAVGIFDLPGGRKAAGMAGHRSHWFCAICNCYHLDTRGRTDCENWENRDVQSLRDAALRWKYANTYAERQAIFKDTGVRWSEMWQLPYWNPPLQLAAEPMHLLLEGLAEDHSRGVLNISVAEASRPLVEPPAFEWEFSTVGMDSGLSISEIKQVPRIHTLLKTPLSQPDDKRPTTDQVADSNRLDDEDDIDEIAQGDVITRDIHWLSTRLSAVNLAALRFVCDDLGISPVHTGRILKVEYVRALLGWREKQPYKSNPAEQSAPVRLITPQVMARIKEVIEEMETPSWLGSFPNTYGSPAAGSLKADQWRTLFTVYLPIALISLWGEGSKHESLYLSSRLHDILDHTMSLVSAILLACSRNTSVSRAKRYREHIRAYVTNLPCLYSHLSRVTNQHVAFHIYDFLLLFGPAHSWWGFPYERLIGHLQRLPSNHKPGMSHFFYSWYPVLIYFAQV